MVFLAQEEARLLNHDFIGTEHLLIGLVQERDGIAAQSLRELGITLEAVRGKVEELVGPGAATPSVSPPFTPRAKKVLELSLRESLQLGHHYIGTEHFLLGIVREGEGVGARALIELGVDPPRVRQVVIQHLSGYQDSGSGEGTSAAIETSVTPRCPGCLSDLAEVVRYRSMTVPPSSPNPFPLAVDVVFCGNCGRIVTMLRSGSADPGR